MNDIIQKILRWQEENGCFVDISTSVFENEVVLIVKLRNEAGKCASNVFSLGKNGDPNSWLFYHNDKELVGFLKEARRELGL